LPRPGPWLGRFRLAMAVPMALTAIALGWLLWRQSGSEGLWISLLASAVLILLFAMYRVGAIRVRFAATILAVSALILFAGTARMLPNTVEAGSARQLGGATFDEARLAGLRAEGRPIFLYFTADWCVTCKVNEAAAINRAETEQLFREKGIVVMIGDFTRRDPAIARFLAAHGRSGVPLYLYYPARGTAVELPQILTPAIIAETVGK